METGYSKLRRALAALLTVLTIAFLPALASADDPDLDSLLIESVGGRAASDSLAAMTTYHALGRVWINDLEGTFDEYFVAPNKSYLRIDLEPFTLVQAYNGRIAWQLDHGGRVSHLQGVQLRTVLENLYFDSYSYLIEARMSGGQSLVGIDTIEGVPHYRVEHYPLSTDTVVVWHDASSAWPVLSQETTDGVESVIERSDFRRVHGILFPFHELMTAEEAQLTMEYAYDEIVLNQPVSPGLFDPPTNTLADFRFPADQSYVDIPCQYLAGHILVDGMVNGRRRGRFLLDSGSSANIIDAAVANDLKLDTTGSLPTRGMGGFDRVGLVRTDSVQLGPLTMLDQVAGVIDLAAILPTPSDGKPLIGILGYDFLSRFPILVDYEGQRLRVFNPDRFTAPPGGSEVPFHLTMLVPTVEAELVGFQGDFLVDLGNPFGLLVHHHFSSANHLPKILSDLRPIDTAIGGVGGAVGGFSAYAATFRLGDIALSDMRVLLAASHGGLASSEALAGNIGNRILEGFQVLLDYADNRIILYPKGAGYNSGGGD